MTTVLLVGFAALGRRRASGAAGAVAALHASAWGLPFGRLQLAVAPNAWWRGADIVRAAAVGADVVLLAADSRKAKTLAIATAAHNRADPAREDADGYRWAGAQLAPGGPAELAGGLSPKGLAKALAGAGYPASLEPAPDAFVANRCLYDLARAGGPPAALLFAPGPDCLAPDDLVSALKAALVFAAAAAELAPKAPRVAGA